MRGYHKFLLGMIAACTFTSAVRAGQPLTFEERVKAQEAVERVYYAHRLWPKDNPQPKPPFEEMVPKPAIEAKVADALKKGNALETFWRRPVGQEQLQAEMDRMARGSQDPAMLQELFAALGNDPHLIAECLARPLLTDRLIHNWYANDTRFHAGVKELADCALKQADPDNLEAWPDGTFRKVTYRVETPRGRRELKDLAEGEVAMDADALARLLARLPKAGELALREDPEAFLLIKTLVASETEVVTESLVFSKQGFDLWWDREAGAVSKDLSGSRSEFCFRLPQQNAIEPACTDSWRDSSLSHPDVPDPRYGHTAVWTGTEMIVWGGSYYLNTGGRYNPATDTWLATSTGENCPSGRTCHTAVWTGAQMIVWGGTSCEWCYDQAYYLNSGGAYDPMTDAWTATSAGSGCPSGRWNHTAVWNGIEMIVWGGTLRDSSYRDLVLNSGGRYKPGNNTWMVTSTGENCPMPQGSHTAVWTGKEMIIWGGYYDEKADTSYPSGGRYDPLTDTWIPVTPAASLPLGYWDHCAVWTGSEMIVWGGWCCQGNECYANIGGRYAPETDTWLPTSEGEYCPEGRVDATAIWTGTEMIVWGGMGYYWYLNTGGRYNPSTDTWTATSTDTNCPTQRERHTAVWTGTEMIIWGGAVTVSLNTGGRYHPDTDSWVPTSTGIAGARNYQSAVWTGAEMIVWGGSSGYYLAPHYRTNTGGRYSLALDSWMPTSTGENCPSERAAHTAVWTGLEMVIWAGQNNDLVNSGGRYSPSTDTWIPTSTGTDCPEARYGHTAVWTGTEMIAWGGNLEHSQPANTGGRYNPLTDSWTATPTGEYCPSERGAYTAIWTGSEMIIWGGIGYPALYTGGKYNPTADHWTPTSTGAFCPEGRFDHTAVWSGSEMLIWGGNRGDHYAAGLFTGARYNPLTDSWREIPPEIGLIKGRDRHSAIWTGSEMIIWGGLNYPDGFVSGGGRYNPFTDSWLPTAEGENCPFGRLDHMAFWTGDSMIVWGGNPTTATGGIYASLPTSISLTPAVGPSSGSPPLTVVFTSNAIPAGCSDSLSYAWDFGDGTGSTERNPVHTYWAVNTFPWKVTASVNGMTATQNGTVTVTQPPCEGFTCVAAVTPSSGQTPLAVAFSASADAGVCTGPVTFSWDFGDGQTSASPEEVHLYRTPGTFGWVLTVMVDGVPCTRQGTVTVTCIAPAVNQVTQKGEPFRLKIGTQAALTEGWKVYLAGQSEPWAAIKVKSPIEFVIKEAGSLFKKDGSETVITIVNGDGCAYSIAYNRKAKSWRPLGE